MVFLYSELSSRDAARIAKPVSARSPAGDVVMGFLLSADGC
jgi:hypothetical protein